MVATKSGKTTRSLKLKLIICFSNNQLGSLMCNHEKSDGAVFSFQNYKRQSVFNCNIDTYGSIGKTSKQSMVKIPF